MKKLFFVIFNSYYKYNNYRDNIATSFTVCGLFALSIFCLSISALTIFSVLSNNYYKPPKFNFFSSILGTAVCLVISYLLFFYKDKHKEIFEMYKDDAYLTSSVPYRLGNGFLILCMLSPFILVLIRNKIILGRWV